MTVAPPVPAPEVEGAGPWRLAEGGLAAGVGAAVVVVVAGGLRLSSVRLVMGADAEAPADADVPSPVNDPNDGPATSSLGISPRYMSPS